MIKTPEGIPSSADVKNNPKKLPALREMGRAAVEAVKRTLETVIGRDFGKQAKNTSDTIAPEYPVYPKPSFPEFVTTPDGNRSPVESGNTPAELAIIQQKDKARAAANPEGLTPYEQAMRDKYLGDEYDEAEYGDDEPKKIQETYDAATNLKIARSRFAKASVAVESHFFKKYFGGKGRQAELEAAAEQLKQSELEYMRLKFADKIEAVKRDPEKQAELAAEMAQAAFASMQETSRTTTDKYDDMLDDRGKFKKAAAKVGK